jgi:energy-coupling factor transporter ATP-binding protein EcfA2
VSTKIKDLVEIVPTLAPAGRDGREHVLAAFLLTYELGDTLTRIVERVALAAAQPRNCLIVGSSGCGKSTLLRAVCGLLQSDASSEMHPRLAAIRSTVGHVKAHVVRVPSPGEERALSAAVERAVLDYLADNGIDRGEAGSIARLDLLASAAAGLPEGERVVVAIDDLDEWLRGAGRFAYGNLQTLGRLGELSRTLPVATCAVAGSGVLYDDANAGDGKGWMAALHADYQIEYLPSHVIRTATASQVLRKNARQHREILEVLGRLREKLPELNYGDEEFIELYPLEVSTWTIGGHLHRWIDGFSFPEFAARAADSVKRRPALSLFALNDMFAFYEAQLRRVESLQPFFAVYDRLVAEAIPQLAQSHRLWASLALQSIFMHTIAGISVDVITLTNSVLLYSLHGSGSSYVFMAAVLKQLETLGRGQIVAAGEGSARRYGLVTGQREAVIAHVDEVADAIDDEDEVAWALLSFGGHFFADWPIVDSTAVAGRNPIWEVGNSPGAVTVRAIGDDDEGERPSLVILAAGRPWSDARDVVGDSKGVACWIGAAPTPTGTQTVKKWIAVTRLADDERFNRFADLATLRTELDEQAASVFRRTYIERGTLVTVDRSDQVEPLLHPSREENLVARFLPAEVVAATAAGAAVSAVSSALVGVPFEDARWFAHLTAATLEDVEEAAKVRDGSAWQRRFEAWYAAGVSRDLAVPAEHFGGQPLDVPEIAAAVEAKQQIDVALFNVRKALSAGSLGGLRDAIETVFDTPDALWRARERVDWLEKLVAWLGTVDRAERYLRETEPVDDQDVEALKSSLLEWIDRPEGFVDERRRGAFADAFAAFRDEYVTTYATEHDRGVGPEVIDRLCNALIASQAWLNLEAFSSLPVGNPSYLVEATNLISMVREARCDADVRRALAEWPRCSCGFRFGDRARVAALVSSAGELVQSGIKHHRRLLQARKSELRAKLKARKTAYSVETIKRIAALTSDNDLPEIDADTIAALNDLLESREL